MFCIHSVTLKDFKSFSGTHTFEFPTKYGLYLVTGMNLESPRLGPNGIGKSTLLDAIYWCFYGRTSRGLKGGDVITWEQKSCIVTVDLTVGDERFQITRKQSPNALLFIKDDPIPVDQDYINKALRLSAQAFLYSVLIPQFGDLFFDLSPSDKLTLFTKIMDLDYWMQRSDDAHVLAVEIGKSKLDSDLVLMRFKTQIETITEDIETLNTQVSEFDRIQDELVSKLEAKLRAAKELQPKLVKQLQRDRQFLLGAEERLVTVSKKIKVLEATKNTITKAKTENTVQWGIATSQRLVFETAIERLGELGALCPECLQTIDKKHVVHSRKLIQSKIAPVIERENEFKAKDEEFVLELRDTNTKANALAKDLDAITQNRTDFVWGCSRVEGEIERNNKLIVELRTEINEGTNRANPHIAMLKDKQRSLVHAKEQVAKLERQIEKLEKELAAVTYLVGGFKRVRLFLVEEALQQLELEVNNNLASLGLLNWRIEFDVERENKSGGVTKGFIVLVHAPKHSKPVRLEAWSGGETQRLRLAGDLGLANLIMERAGLRNTVEFFDEPSRHLSPEGLLDLAETLAQRAETDKKCIYLVDHHSIDFGGFEDTIFIIKDDNGSRIKNAPVPQG